MTSRKELIEEAVKAAWSKRRIGVGGQVVESPPQDLYFMIRAAFDVFEQAHAPTDDFPHGHPEIDPEPQGREAKIHGEFVTMRVDEWRRITDELARLRTMEGQMEEPQGEPTDAEVLAALGALMPDVNWSAEAMEAANPTWIKNMRAALRAALRTAGEAKQ